MALSAIDLEIDSIDQGLAIDHLANLLEHLDTTRIDHLTMARLTILDRCRRYLSESLQSSIEQLD